MRRKVEVQVFPQTTAPPRYHHYTIWQIVVMLFAISMAVVGFVIIDPISIIRKWTDVSLFRLYAQNKDLQKTIVQVREKTNDATKHLAKSDSLRNLIIKTAGISQIQTKVEEEITEEKFGFGSIGPARNMNRIRLAHSEFRQLLTHFEENPAYARTLPLIQPLKRHFMVTGRYGLMHDEVTGGEIPHQGIDWATFEGDTVIAPGSGMVASIVNEKGFGLSMTIVHNERIETFYAHLSSVLVNPGQSVIRGKPIALVGKTGRSMGPHLHYEMRLYGKQVNPQDYFITP